MGCPGFSPGYPPATPMSTGRIGAVAAAAENPCWRLHPKMQPGPLLAASWVCRCLATGSNVRGCNRRDMRTVSGMEAGGRKGQMGCDYGEFGEIFSGFDPHPL